MTQQHGIRFSSEGADRVQRDFAGIGSSGEKMGRELERGSKRASSGLKEVDSTSKGAQAGLKSLGLSAGQLPGPLGQMAGSLENVVGQASKLGPVGVAAGVALAAIGGAAVVGIRQFAEFEQAGLRIDAVLRATGNTAGLTREQIMAFSEDLARSTQASTGAVQDAAAQLLTFRKISGDTFFRTLTVAQDMATVFKGDIVESTRTLARALENPAQGLSSLEDKGIKFSAAQRAVIESLIATGRHAEAMAMILGEVEERVGGAGESAGGGIAGSFHALAENTKILTAAWSESTGVALAFADALKAVADWSTDAVQPEQRMESLRADIERLEKLSEGGIMGAARRWASVAFSPGPIAVRNATDIPFLERQLEMRREELAVLERQEATEGSKRRIAAAKGEFERASLELAEHVANAQEKARKLAEQEA